MVLQTQGESFCRQQISIQKLPESESHFGVNSNSETLFFVPKGAICQVSKVVS